MLIAKIRVTGTYAKVLKRQPVPSGLIGGEIIVEYDDPLWNDLRKIVIFNGVVTRDIITENTTIVIPHETVATANKRLQVGFQGVDTEDNLVIPTFYADLGIIQQGADPSGDEAADPTMPVWADLMSRMEGLEGDMKDLEDHMDDIDSDINLEGYATEEWVEEKLKEHSGGNVDLTGYAKEQWVQQNYQPKGNYALKSEIPSVPVQSVNGKTGAVKLSASDVGARPNNWMPSAQEVGALPNTYTPPNQTAEQVGADPKGTAASAVSQHNASADSHGDIRLELKAINDRLTAFFDSDDQTLDELSEIVAYITSNKSLIDSITTSKVSVADIVNNLTSNVSNKPLSAAQGVVLKGLIDAVSTSLANYQPKGNYLTEETDPTVPAWAKQSTKPSYSKSEVGLGNVDNVKQYSASNPPPYPVTSVNGMTGAVTLDISGKVDKSGLTLGRDESGLLYILVDGVPVGDGVELPTGGIDGYITADNQIIFNNLPDGEYTIAYVNEDGTIVPIGELEKDTNVYYTVTNTLTNCTNSNSATKVVQGSAYSATITAKSGYELKSVTVTMGGSPVTVSGGTISIANVTGNIVITAVAEEIKAAYTNLANPASSDWATGKRFDGSGNLKDVDAGVNGATTNYIGGSFAVGDVIRIKGMDLTGGSYRTAVYDKNKSLQSLAVLSGQGTYFSDIIVSSTSASFKINSGMPSYGYIRFSGVLNGTSADVIITKNEEIS